MLDGLRPIEIFKNDRFNISMENDYHYGYKLVLKIDGKDLIIFKSEFWVYLGDPGKRFLRGLFDGHDFDEELISEISAEITAIINDIENKNGVELYWIWLNLIK